MKKVADLLLFPILLFAVRWPVGDMDSPRPIGNSWGAIQTFLPDYPYLHPGVDVMGVTTGQPVHAVAPGVVKAWLTTQGDLHWRLAIADSETTDSCDGWLYAHIDPYREHKEVGDWISEGDIIGYVVDWPLSGFHHLHWARIRGAGATWFPDWRFIDNPAVDLNLPGDTISPIFFNTWQNELLSFRRNNSIKYLYPDSLYGDVDIIARIHDKTGMYWEYIQDTILEHLTPMEVWYEIHGPQSADPVRSFILDGHLQDLTDHIELIYSRDYYRCHSVFDYEQREYYFFLTNTDGDSLREWGDYDSCWHTAEFPDGNYWVVVTAKDAAGNTAVDSMHVKVVNGTGAEENRVADLYSIEFLNPVIIKGAPLKVICRTEEVLRVFDVNGRKQRDIEIAPSMHPQEVVLDRLPAGVYFIRIESQATCTHKFIIVR